MEFLLGVISTFLTIAFVRRFILTQQLIKKTFIPPLVYRQSHIKLLTQVADQYLFVPAPIETQSRKVLQKNQIRIIFSEHTAYWIKNNMLLQAAVTDGQVDESTTKVVDTMTMDKVELDKMIFIVQKLTEGITNDGGNSGI